MKIKDLIEINDKQYTVVSVIKYDTKKYGYLININNYNDFIFVEIHTTSVEIIDDKEKLKELIKLFNDEINKQKLSGK